MRVECLYRRGRAGRPRATALGRASPPPVAPVCGAPGRPMGGDRPPFHPRAPGQGPRCKFKEKKLHLGYVAPIRQPGYIFEIFRNGHIFLKF